MTFSDIWTKPTLKSLLSIRKLVLLFLTLEIQSSHRGTNGICSASHHGNEQYNPSQMSLCQHELLINQLLTTN